MIRYQTDDEGVVLQPEYTLTKPSNGPNDRDHLTVPPTVGVISRRKNDSRAEKTNCTSDETTTRLASSDRPPQPPPTRR